VGDHRQRHYAAGVRPGIASQRGTGGRRRAANLRVVWCARTSGQADPTPFFPGDASTSWFALDGYDRPGPWCVLHGVPHHVSPVHTDQRPARDNRRDDFCREPTRPIGRGHLDHLGVLPGDPHLGHLVAVLTSSEAAPMPSPVGSPSALPSSCAGPTPGPIPGSTSSGCLPPRLCTCTTRSPSTCLPPRTRSGTW
jgi:hypothetical protein